MVGYVHIRTQFVCNSVLHHCWVLVCELIVIFCSVGPALEHLSLPGGTLRTLNLLVVFLFLCVCWDYAHYLYV